MRAFLFAAAAALALSSGAALAAGTSESSGGGNGGVTLPHAGVPPAVGSTNAVPKGYTTGPNSNVPTASSTSGTQGTPGQAMSGENTAAATGTTGMSTATPK